MNEKNDSFVITTRQKADMLWLASLVALQAAGKTQMLPVVEVDGYQMVSLLLISDQPFTISIQESVSPTGPFIPTDFFSSVVDAASGLQTIIAKVKPAGAFMSAVVTNTGNAAQKVLQLGAVGYGNSGM